MSLPINEIVCGDCLEVLKSFPDESIDLVVTSPPYDSLRTYNDKPFNFSNLYPQNIFRILKKGGVVVWVIGDQVINGSETLSAFKQAISFRECCFNLHDTMIYQKDSFPSPQSNRYLQCFEYMFVFSKGTPKTFHPIMVTTKGYKPSKSSTKRYPNGETKVLKYEQGKAWRKLENIWKYGVGYMKSTTDIIAFEHPATFPEELVADHIKSWSNEGDIVLDPFVGSGTTSLVARKLCRNHIGIELDPKYVEIARKRLMAIPEKLDGFLKEERR